MKLYLNTFIVLLMAEFGISDYAKAAGLYTIITQLEQDGLTQVLDYEGYMVMLGEDIEHNGINLKKLVERITEFNLNPDPKKVLHGIKAGT